MRRPLPALILVALLLPAIARAQCLDYSDYEHWAGRAELTGEPGATCLIGSHVCVTTGPTGLFLVDVSQPGAPSVTASLDTPGSTWGVDGIGTLLLVADGSNGLLTVDISNPAAPSIVNTLASGSLYSIRIVGPLAYAAGGGMFHVLDVSDPLSPAILGSLSIGGDGYDLDVSGPFVYVAASNGLHVIDVGSPANPVAIGFVAPSYDIMYAVDVEGNYAFVIEPFAIDEYGGLRVFDVSNPAAPAQVGIKFIFGGAIEVLVDGSTAYVCGTSSLYRYDVSDPSEPTYESVVFSESEMYRLTLAEERLFIPVAGYNYAALEIVDLSGSIPSVIATTSGVADFDIQVQGDYAFTSGRSSMGVVNVSNPRSPAMVTSRSINRAERLDVENNVACVTRRTLGLTLVDVSSPASPVIRGTINTIGEVLDVDARGIYAYVAGSQGVSVVNISNPQLPALVRQLAIGVTKRVTVSGDHLYALRGAGVTIFDLVDPSWPAFLSFYPKSGEGLVVSGTKAYLAGGALEIFDVTDPASPTFAGRAEAPWLVGDIEVSDGFAYAGAQTEGVAIFNVADTANPRFCGSHRGAGPIDNWNGGAIKRVGDVLYACSGYMGISVIEPQCPATSDVDSGSELPRSLSLGAPFPNPFQDEVHLTFETPDTRAPMTAMVYSVSGRRIRRMLIGPGGSRYGRLTWDGRDESGNESPAGVYFIRLSNGAEAGSRRIVRSEP